MDWHIRTDKFPDEYLNQAWKQSSVYDGVEIHRCAISTPPTNGPVVFLVGETVCNKNPSGMYVGRGLPLGPYCFICWPTLANREMESRDWNRLLDDKT